MTRVKDIVDAYCDRHGLRVIGGKLGDNDPAPILPFIIMDAAQYEFQKEIAPLHMHHSLKRWRKQWQSDYHAFNQRLFSCLDADKTDFTIEMMDAYTEAIGYNTMLMRVAVMDLVNGLEFDEQKLIASLMLCNIYAQVAQITWGLVFHTNKGHDAKCPELERMRNISHKLANGVVLIPDNIDPNASPKLHDAVEAYMSKTTDWLKSYKND